MKTVHGSPLLISLILGLSACGAPADESAPASEADESTASEGPSVAILGPAEGMSVDGPQVEVSLAAAGIRIVPAGEVVPGTGHHHLYLDADLGEPGVPVPTVPGRVVHLGTGVSEYTFEDVPPGEHRIIAVIADGLHVPIQPWVVDTVDFVVR
ncbi:MAG: DUF4399 domain-containing protein [Gemmatimonadota bacterium]|jgi:hypothetical protein